MKLIVTSDGKLLLSQNQNVTEMGIVDFKSSTFGRLPETAEETESIPGVDGETITDFRLSARAMEIVLYSDDGLTKETKAQIVSALSKIASASQDGEIELIDQYHFTSDRYRLVRYSGAADDPDENPGWLSVSIPLKAWNPLWYSKRASGVQGGYAVVKGSHASWPTLTATGGSANPSATIDGTVYAYSGTVPAGNTLSVDFKDARAVLLDESGNEVSDVTVNWNGNFTSLAHGKHTVALSGGASLNWHDCWA